MNTNYGLQIKNDLHFFSFNSTNTCFATNTETVRYIARNERIELTFTYLLLDHYGVHKGGDE